MMRRLVLLFVAAVCSLTGYSQNNYVEIINYEEIDGMIVFPLTVNGVQCKFLFDPMGVLSVLDTDAEKLGFQLDKDITEQNGGIAIGNIFRINLGKTIFKDKMLVYSRPNEFLRKNGISGTMASPLFFGYVLTINSKDKTLTISTPYRPNYVNVRNFVNMEKDYKSFMLDIDGKSIPVGFGFASGKQLLTLTPSDAAHILNKEVSQPATITRRDSSYVSHEAKARKYEVKELTFANNVINGADIYSSGEETRSMLGKGLLDKGVVSFDYLKMRIYFQPYDKIDPALYASFVPVMPTSGYTDENSAIIDLNRVTFADLVFDYKNEKEWKYKGSIPAIIDFWAPWCAPCKDLGKTIEELAPEYKDKIKIYKINVDKEPEIAAYFGVNQIPVVLFISMKGQPYALMGNAPKESLIERIEALIRGDELVL